MSISVALLAYKEEENLRVLLPQINDELSAIGESYEILVVDSAEPMDNTRQVCAENGARYINQEEPYFAGAFRTAIHNAENEKFLILDADCSHDPSAIPVINEKFDETGADIVIGSRYCEGGVSNDSKASRMMSAVLNWLFRKALKVDARDISTDYRMYRTDDLKRTKLTCERYDVLQEVILQIKIDNGGTIYIEEVPIVFQKRAFGQSKRQLLLFIMHYLETFIRLTRQRRAFERSQKMAKL